MKTIIDSTDKVGSLIRQAGPETPPQGMRERIMHRIEATALKKSPDFSPVISIRTWIYIGGSAVALIILFLVTGSNGENNGKNLFNADPLLRSLHNLNLSFHFNLQVPKSLIFGLAGLLLLFSLDFLLTTLKWKRVTSKDQP
jgi:hypothetical protein